MVNGQGFLEDADIESQAHEDDESQVNLFPLEGEETLSEESSEEKKFLLMRTIRGYIVRGMSKVLL